MSKTTEINRMKNPTIGLVTRMITTLLLMSIATLTVSLVLGTIIPEDWGSGAFWLACLSIPMTLLVCVSLYGGAWQFGEREHNLVKHGHVQYDPYKGIKAGFIVFAPGFIFALLAATLAGSAHETADAIGLIAQFFHTCLFTTFYWLAYITGGADRFSALAYFVPVAILPLLSAIGFYLGYRAIYLRTYILYSKREIGKMSKRNQMKRR
jgi:hypothetical protein